MTSRMRGGVKLPPKEGPPKKVNPKKVNPKKVQKEREMFENEMSTRSIVTDDSTMSTSSTLTHDSTHEIVLVFPNADDKYKHNNVFIPLIILDNNTGYYVEGKESTDSDNDIEEKLEIELKTTNILNKHDYVNIDVSCFLPNSNSNIMVNKALGQYNSNVKQVEEVVEEVEEVDDETDDETDDDYSNATFEVNCETNDTILPFPSIHHLDGMVGGYSKMLKNDIQELKRTDDSTMNKKFLYIITKADIEVLITKYNEFKNAPRGGKRRTRRKIMKHGNKTRAKKIKRRNTKRRNTKRKSSRKRKTK